MSYRKEITHLKSSALAEENVWSWESQTELAALKAPELLMGMRGDLLQGDVSREWMKWVIEQFIDYRYLEENYSYIRIFSDIYCSINALLGMQLHDDEKKEVSKLVAELVSSRVEGIKEQNRRKTLSLSLKNELLDIYATEGKLRCWLTGYEFSNEAVYNFTASHCDRLKLKLPDFVDRIRPIGLNESDLRIEVDHLYPHSLGGRDVIDNYRLICGWANRVKSNHVSGYSIGTRMNKSSGIWPKSYSYWMLRLLGMKRKCEVSGCHRHLGNSELTVESIYGPSKAITPTSMRVVCYEHSQLPNRFLPRNSFSDKSFGGYFDELKLAL